MLVSIYTHTKVFGILLLIGVAGCVLNPSQNCKQASTMVPQQYLHNEWRKSQI